MGQTDAARPDAPAEPVDLVVLSVDLSGRVTAASEGACGLLGRPRSEVVGSRFADHLAAADDDPLAALLDETEASHQVVLPLRRLDGCTALVRVTATLLRDEDGSPVGVTALLQDAQKLAADERRRVLQEEYYATLATHAHDLVLLADGNGRLLYASPAVQHMFGYDVQDLEGVEGWGFVHPDDVEAVRSAYQAVVDDGLTRTAVFRVQAADGSWRWVEETMSNYLDSAMGAVVAHLRDVSEQVRAQEALRESEGRFRAFSDAAQEGIWVVTSSGSTVYANQRMASLVGVPLARLYEEGVLVTLLDPASGRTVLSRIATRQERGPERYEIPFCDSEGRHRVLLVSAAPLVLPGGRTGSMALVSDVTEARRNEELVRRAVLHDPLTGLPNRTLLLDRLEHALVRGSAGTAVVFLDLDGMRLVNDAHGRDGGDAMLRAAADRLRQAARPEDTVARFGSDELLVVLEDVDTDTALQLARRMQDGLTGPVGLDGGPAHLQFSVGVAVSPPCPARSLLRSADVALQQAKARGGGCIELYDVDGARDTEEDLQLAAELADALSHDGLHLRYQPLVALGSGRVVGVEALVRWQHPVHGFLPAERFVPVAEATGLGGRLDRWVLRRAVEDALTLRETGALPPDAHVAVNLCAADLDEAHADEVAQALRDKGMPPHDVVVEVAERLLVRRGEELRAALLRLRQSGFRVALDEYGTACVPLSSLCELDATTLALDRALVVDVVSDERAAEMVRGVVAAAHASGMVVVAKGVESGWQAARLRQLGCDVGQGWVWSRPLTVEEAVAAEWCEGFGTGEPELEPVAAAVTVT